MLGKDCNVASWIRASLKACALLGGCVILAGCDMPPSAQSAGTRTMPNQEQFLLSLVERNFQDPEAQYQLGEYYRCQGRWDKAQYHLDLALNFAPALRKAQVGLVRMLVDKGDHQAADRTANRFYRQLSGSPLEMADLAKAFAGGGLDQYALACFTEATKASPGSAPAFKELGLYWLAKNDTAKAKSCLTRSFELDPSQSDVAEALGRLGVVVEVPRTPSEPAAQVPPPNPAAPR